MQKEKAKIPKKLGGICMHTMHCCKENFIEHPAHDIEGMLSILLDHYEKKSFEV